ncbi:hypothetical protein [Bacteroides fragilis]|uniref:hypothetical protein n=1 Tax=Bacteroides fragilis TaxID=817 RepID=UPI001F4335B4|nr:hypothetical protein [Bacteroides fragilis]
MPNIKVKIAGRFLNDFIIPLPVYVGYDGISIHHSLHFYISLLYGFGFNLIEQPQQCIHFLVVANFRHI